MNNLYQQLNQNNMNKGLMQLINNFKRASNPQFFIESLIQSNPQMKNIYSALQKSNKTPKELFYLLAQ